ncbi:MAG: tRNA-(ms[2]io[6]A)-hydroxylase [Pseudomonadaceae bacterium]|nr:tRNA-(ms[2]io[6]A)-hydroxylase [Pseudomonadaceae bacterium]
MSVSNQPIAGAQYGEDARVDLEPVRRFLSVATPAAWLTAALADLPTLLADHANCERKAANTALALIARYPEHTSMLQQLSRLAREEMRHFEQVVALMQERGIAYRRLSASRYAGGLMQSVRAGNVERLVDTLIVGAVVEARSCERFAALVHVLEPVDAILARFYARLLASEARHFEVYLDLARAVCSAPGLLAEVDERIAHFVALDADLVCSDDPQFRFHSGAPASGRHCSS